MGLYLRAVAALVGVSVLGACAAPPPAAPVAAPLGAPQSILQSSTPADGSTVRGAVNEIFLRFSPPARLGELTVTGSDGQTMPMMVTAVGEVPAYSIPVPGLGTGGYAVQWRATVGGTAHSGSFRFTVR
jgi:methionine-rich copper-binding protein CopC